MSMNLKTTKRNNLYLSIATVLGGFAFFATGTTYAAAPAAGTNISNIATASYVDGTSTTRTVTSNEVKTTVLQVGSFTLEQDRSATANPNGVVTLSHVLTNTGNGTDKFTLSLANIGGDAFDFSNIAIYLDANKDGVPDNNTNLMGQVITLNAGESVGLVVVGTTASTAKADESGQLTLSAASGYITVPADKTKTNTDTVKIVGGAVIQVTKSANVTAVTRGDTVTYELTYKNTGNADATNLTIEDILPAGVTYVAGSARWSGQTAALTDAANDETAAKYKYESGILTLVLASVPRNSTGKLTFQVTVNASAPAGKITNIATFDPDGPGTESPQPTNPYDVTVQSTYIGTINDLPTDPYSDAEVAGSKDDLISTTAVQGSPILFGASSLTEDIWIHNLGNVTETYNIKVDKSKLPPGSIVELLKSDGNTPLTDTNGDASVDSGPLASGGHLEISARITLPSGYTGPTPFVALDTILIITPVHGTLADKITLRITDITASKVDLSNGKGNKDYIENDTPLTGEGAYVAGNIVTTVTTKPGVAGTFPIAVTNGGSTADNYNFGTDQPLPSGWTVEYFVADSAGVCSSTKVTNTGAIQPNATAYFCAKVTPSANATPANSQDIVFTINSPATGLTDKMKDRLVVEAVRGLSFLADQQGQVAPGGTIVYKHTLTNNGNVVEGLVDGTLSVSITHDPATSGFVTSVYVDKDNDGVADPEELVTDLQNLNKWLTATGVPVSADGLSPNESINILVKVEAPSNATAGQADLSIITVTPTGTLNGTSAPTAVTVTDKTTVNIGQVRLEKLQALDDDCDGLPNVGSNFGTSTLQAKPGACIIYQIKAVNDGNQAVTKVVITDAVPSYTTLGSTPAAALDPVSKGSVSNTANNLKSTEFALAPSETVTMKFSVKVDGQ